ncbi:MAG: glycosyl hydrolase [Flavobacteriales bacterium]|nr:glycosyl hydrolase [Flavobacteriales bacterium]
MRNGLLFSMALFFGVVFGFSQELSESFKPLKYRNIGPFRGGRANAGTGVIGDPMTYYMGTTGGGVWKTSDAGQHWKNISDGFFKLGSVGAIAVSESNPNVVYVGMGEHAPRGVMTSHGDGVYKSSDAGKTWTSVGLEKTQHISRIVIHPTNSDILWVAAQGALHGPTQERGIYKSVDGGKSWKKTLYVNTLTGASELSIDSNNPNVLYAALWEHIRKPWQVVSGGSGSGLYKSTDGGETWKKIHKGLPKEKGKMAIAVSPANSQTVFALIESDSQKEKGGLFVSKDAGDSWSRISGDHRLIQRAWYYIEIALDPNNEDIVYVMSASTYKSTDGGQSWNRMPSAHGDYHDLWINPQNSSNMILTSDGGSEITFDGGSHWSRIDHLPTAQFYRINTDNLYPYHIYGGQQDNSSVKIASIGIGSGGIGVQHWTSSAGGESAFLAFDPDRPTKVMGGSYLGTIDILDVATQQSTEIMMEPNLYLGLAARDMKYLYNWNAPIIRSQHEENTYFHCAQYVLRTRDEGLSWEVISPDLTRNQDKKQGKGGGPYTNEAVGAENYGTISYMVESPHEMGVFYTGSDDGLVYRTKDNGVNWENVTPKGLEETLINSIEVSPHDPATVYIATTRYKFNDFTPALYKSTNYGQSWKLISKTLPKEAYTKVVREDTARKDLLFAGTVEGVYASWDGGLHWKSLQLNLPQTPITDLKVAHNDLVVATQGRSFWILDDLEFLRQTEGQAANNTKLYTPTAAFWAHWYSSMNSNSPSGQDSFEGVNPATGMVLYYELNDASKEQPIHLQILDAEGRLVNEFHSDKDPNYKSYEGAPSPPKTLMNEKGLNRFVWNLRHRSLPGAPEVYIEGSYSGHKAIPGRYTIRLKQGELILETKAEIIPNPEISLSKEDYQVYHEFMSAGEAAYTEMTMLTNRMYSTQQRLKQLLKKLDQDGLKKLHMQGKNLLKAMSDWDAKMVQRLSKAYDDVENYENGFTAHYITLINQVDSDIPKITVGAQSRMKELNAEWAVLKKEGQAIQSDLIPAFNQACYEQGIGVLPQP